MINKNNRRRLGVMERAMAATSQSYPFNIVAVLRIANAPLPDQIKKAAAVLRRRHPLLGASIKIGNKQFSFNLETGNEILVDQVHRKNDKTWQTVAQNELNTPINILSGPLIRIHYVSDRGSAYEAEIILTFHHAAVDGTSGTFLIDELLRFCAGETGTETASSNQETEELKPAAEAFFPPEYKGIQGKISNIIYFMRMMADEISYKARTINSRKAPIHKTGSGRILLLSFSEQISSLLWKQARKKRLTVNRLFDAALLMAVHKRLYNDMPTALRFFTFADLRPFLVPPVPFDVTGSYFSMMRFTATLKPKIRLTDLTRQIQENVYTALKRGDKFCAHLQSGAIMKMLLRFKAFRMGATALSHSPQVSLKENYGTINLNEVRAFTSNFVLGPEYTAQTRFFKNRFFWDILYLDSDMDEILAKTIADDISRILKSFAQGEL